MELNVCQHEVLSGTFPPKKLPAPSSPPRCRPFVGGFSSLGSRPNGFSSPFNAELGNLGVWSCFVHHHGMHITRVLETAKIYCRHKRCVCVLSWRGQPKSLPNPEATIRFATCLQRRDVGTPAPTVLQNRSSKHAPPTSSCLPPLQRGTINVNEQKIGV